MSIAARTVLALSTVAVAVVMNGCGAAPDGSSETIGASQAAVTLPEGYCTKMAGQDAAGFAANGMVLRGGGDSDTRAPVVAFKQAIAQIVPYNSTWVLAATGPNFMGYDVTGGNLSAATNVVNQYAYVDPVLSGLFHCTYNWADWQGARPYVPTYIAVYDPRGCTGCT